MRRIVGLLIFLFGVSLTFPSPVLALKQRVSRGVTKSSGTVTRVGSRLGVASSVKFRGDRRAIILTLSDLSKASQVSYTLTYTGNGVSQGVSGSIKPVGESSVTRELVFGTSSAGVYRYHTDISNARLVITTYLKSGAYKKVNKGYRIKI